MSSVATAMLVDIVGEAGGLELAVLVGGAVLGVLREAGLQLWVGVVKATGDGPRCY